VYVLPFDGEIKLLNDPLFIDPLFVSMFTVGPLWKVATLELTVEFCLVACNRKGGAEWDYITRLTV